MNNNNYLKLAQIKTLTYLSLANNQLKTLGSELGLLTLLKTLNLSYNQLASIPKGFNIYIY